MFATPGGFGSVTRVRSALRGRPAPPDPSQTVPHGFAAQSEGGVPAVSTVAPTLSGTIGPTLNGTDELFAPRSSAPSTSSSPEPRAQAKPSGPRVVGVTTVTGSAGESIEMSPSRFPLGLVGALAGAIGLVVLLIVMVMRSSGGGGEAGEDPGGPPKAVAGPGTGAEPEPPKVQPRVEPIVEPIVEPVVEPVTEPEHGPDARDPKGDRTGRVKPPRIKHPGIESGKDPKDPKVPKVPTKDPKDPASGGSNAAGSGDNTTPPPAPDAGVSEEDKWDRMQHDHDKPKGEGS